MRTKPTPPLRAPFRPDSAQDAKDPPIASAANPGERIQNPSAHRPESRDGPDLISLLDTAMSAVDFDVDSIQDKLKNNRSAKSQHVDGRLVAAAAIIVILIFMIDLIVQLI